MQRLYRYLRATRVEDQFAAVTRLPALVQVADQRDDPVSLTPERIDVGPVEVARAVVCQVAFKREQAEKQPAVEVNAQRLGPAAPGRERRVSLVHPVDAVPSNEAIALLFEPPADLGRMVVGGAGQGGVPGKHLRDIRRQSIRLYDETGFLEATDQ